MSQNNSFFEKAMLITKAAASSLEAIKRESPEIAEGHDILGRLIERLKEDTKKLKYYTLEPEEGNLKERFNGSYEINGKELNKGMTIELYSPVNNQWYTGQVAFISGTYYLECIEANNPLLLEGMRVKIRNSPIKKIL